MQAVDAHGAVLARWPSRAVALLLARLVLAPQRAHPREELVDLLWPDAPLEVGRNRLRQVLSTLKSLLEPPDDAAAGPVILADRAAVRLAPHATRCDALEFETCVRSRQHEQAYALYGGPLLPGHFDEWVLEERQRLETLAEGLNVMPLPAATRPSAAAAPLPAATPKHRAPDAGLGGIDAMGASGATSAMGSIGATLPGYLTRLHGAQTALTALEQAVHTHRLVTLIGPGGCGKTRLAVEAARACAARQPPRFDLVVFVSLVGSSSAEGVLEALAGSLRTEARTESLCTALAGHQALLVLDNCEQVATAAAQQVAPLLARLPLLHLLATSRRALGVDGEQVIALPTLPTPDADESGAPGQDREDLGVLAANPAVALFVDRARLARSDFHLTPANAGTVAGLVSWLDGMPLAIELAAARVRTLGPAQMLHLLQQGQPGAPSPLALVARSGPRSGADARHASMVEVVAWSWHLLRDGARQLLAAMALFPGGFTLEAAHAVRVLDDGASVDKGLSASGKANERQRSTLGASQSDRPGGVGLLVARAEGLPESMSQGLSQGLSDGRSVGLSVGDPVANEPSLAHTAQLIDELVEHSMLRPALDGERFAPYEVIREYALAQLRPEHVAQVQAAQRLWLLAWASKLPLTPPLAQVRAEMPNIVAALAACRANAAAAHDAMDLLALLRRCFEDVDLPAAGLRHLESAIAACTDAASASRGRSLIAGLLFSAGRAADALRQARAGLEGAATLEPAARARALHAMASVHWRATKDAAGAWPLIDEAEPLAQAAGALEVQASLCALRAFIVNHAHRDAARAQALHQRALDLWRAQGNQHAVHSGLYNLAVVASRSGGARGAAQALELLEAVVLGARRHGDSHRERQALNVQGNALMAQRRWREAAQVLRECVQQSWRAMAAHDLAYGLWNLPRPLLHLRHSEPALRLMAFAGVYWCGHFGALSADDRHDQRLIRRMARLSLSPARCEALWHEGEQMSLAQAVALALALEH